MLIPGLKKFDSNTIHKPFSYSIVPTGRDPSKDQFQSFAVNSFRLIPKIDYEFPNYKIYSYSEKHVTVGKKM